MEVKHEVDETLVKPVCTCVRVNVAYCLYARACAGV
jgi:hypothetical protein